MKTAFLFPGQGAQYVGMAADLAEAYPEAKERLQQADEILRFPLTTIMTGTGDASADAEALRRTDNTQPALYVHSLAAMAVVERTVKPDVVSGHSLGEYSALAAAGALTYEDGLRIVRLRGELMARAGDVRPGTMAAILGLEDAAVEALCTEASQGDADVVVAANYNAPAQVVISGDVTAVERAMTLAKEKGAKRVVPLTVSGAFHSPLMRDAVAGLGEALEALTISKPYCPVYLNVTAAPTQDPEEIRARLLEQLYSPVRWAQILHNQYADGVRRFTEIGAGNVLTGLARRTLGKDIETVTYGKAEELQAL